MNIYTEPEDDVMSTAGYALFVLQEAIAIYATIVGFEETRAVVAEELLRLPRRSIEHHV